MGTTGAGRFGKLYPTGGRVVPQIRSMNRMQAVSSRLCRGFASSARCRMQRISAVNLRPSRVCQQLVSALNLLQERIHHFQQRAVVRRDIVPTPHVAQQVENHHAAPANRNMQQPSIDHVPIENGVSRRRPRRHGARRRADGAEILGQHSANHRRRAASDRLFFGDFVERDDLRAVFSSSSSSSPSGVSWKSSPIFDPGYVEAECRAPLPAPSSLTSPKSSDEPIGAEPLKSSGTSSSASPLSDGEMMLMPLLSPESVTSLPSPRTCRRRLRVPARRGR